MKWIDRCRKNISGLVPLGFVCCLVALAIKNPPIIDETIETLLVDYRFIARNFFFPPEVPREVAIVTIDEKSLARFGRWPWNRKLQADLIRKVAAGQPRVVAVDIFYPETETPETDAALAEVLHHSGVPLVAALGFEVEDGKIHEGETEESLFDHALLRIENQSAVNAVQAWRVLLPPPPLDSAAHFGHVYSLPTRDGKLRSEALYLQYGDDYFPSLSLLTAAFALRIPFAEITVQGTKGVMLGNTLLGTDSHGRLYINYYGREGTFRHVSAADLLEDRVDPATLQGLVILIGTSAIATYDQKSSPFSANMPGVEKNATVVANILGGDYLRKAPLYINLLFIIVAGAATWMVGSRFSAAASFTALGVLSGLIVLVNQFCFSRYGVLLNLTYPLATTAACGLFVVGHKYFIEEKSGRQIKKMFSSYVTERVVSELIKNPDIARLGGQRRVVSILFSDVRGFTSFAEKNEPEYVVAMLNEYLEAMTDVVFHWEGTLDKFVGDAIVVFWSAPLIQEDHAERAMRCSMHMLKRLESLQQKWREEGKEPLDIGIGLNAGEVLVGNIGAEGKKMDYTVIGDHVNLCARLEALTRVYNTHLIITEHLLRHINTLLENGAFGHMIVKELERVTVQGKEKPVSIYEVRPAESGEGCQFTKHAD